MKSKLYLIIILLSFIFYHCSENEITIPDNCIIQEELGIIESDSLLSFRFFQNLKWKGSYSNEKVKINFNYLYGFHNQEDDYIFEFNRVNNCLEFNKAYYIHSNGFGSPKLHKYIQKIRIDSVKIQDWNENSLISGKMSFSIVRGSNPTSSYSKNFWIEMDSLDYYDEPTTPLFTLDCIVDKLPKELDIDNDGVNDFVFDYIENVEDFSDPTRKVYRLVINPLTQNNYVLETRSYSQYPYIETQSSLSSINSYIVPEERQRSFAFFTEYPLDYIEYNNWVTIVTIEEIYYNKDNQLYIMVKKTQNGLDYYGWINIKISIENCNFEIINSYLNPVPGQHITIP